jgi:hypothetical protein
MFGRVQKTLNESLDSSSWVTVAIDVETYLVKVNLISFKMSNVHSAATKLKVIVSRDQEGDDQLITETESNIIVGKTTASTRCAVYQFDSIVPATDNNTFYIHAKLNSNTATLDRVFVSYEV